MRHKGLELTLIRNPSMYDLGLDPIYFENTTERSNGLYKLY